MEYERIQSVQGGIISPSKLRMKLMGPHHRKKDGSNSNSSRTSPSKLGDSEFVNNSLLTPDDVDFDLEVDSPSLEARSGKYQLARENPDIGRAMKMQQSSAKGDSHGSNSTTTTYNNNNSRTIEDENLDYDSNASSSSFEFHKAERSGNNHITRPLSRPIPSKWNDAEKWIMNRQNGSQANLSSKKYAHQNNGYRLTSMNNVRVAPESANCDHRLLSIGRVSETKRVDFYLPGTQMGLTLVPYEPQSSYGDPCPQSKDLSSSQPLPEESTGGPAIRSVSMRDMGTEMTPIASLEPSRTTTPMGASPFRSPTSSIPSTPRRSGAPAPTPNGATTDEDLQHRGKKELTEEEMKLKTRREIVALGVQLGKMNIAAWASKDEQEKKDKQSGEAVNKEELERIEIEKRASAWEEAEKCRHTARYKREEIKIQVWESQQKLKLEADMRRIEAQVEQLRAQAQAKMMKKIALARQRSEEKRAAAETRKKREAEKTAAQAEYIRQTGRMPTSSYICCGWLM